MKTKLFSIITVLFLLPQFNVKAQQITPDMFTEPVNTGANMTVGINVSKLDQVEGGKTGAFVDLDGDGTLECVGLNTINPGFYAITLWGDDTFTPEVDGAFENESISFQLVDGETLYDIQMPTTVSYIQSGIMAVTSAASFTLASGDDCYRYGCTSFWADNYDALSTVDDGSCIRNGCTSEWANNYDALATDDDGSCYSGDVC